MIYNPKNYNYTFANVNGLNTLFLAWKVCNTCSVIKYFDRKLFLKNFILNKLVSQLSENRENEWNKWGTIIFKYKLIFLKLTEKKIWNLLARLNGRREFHDELIQDILVSIYRLTRSKYFVNELNLRWFPLEIKLLLWNWTVRGKKKLLFQ